MVETGNISDNDSSYNASSKMMKMLIKYDHLTADEYIQISKLNCRVFAAQELKASSFRYVVKR